MAVPLVGACGSDGGSSGGGAAPESGTELGASTDVPVGGGFLFEDAQVIVTQPTEGEFRGFSSVCTHQQCTVSEINEVMRCPCHGSEYALEDGTVVGGPAPSPLEEVMVEVRDGALFTA